MARKQKRHQAEWQNRGLPNEPEIRRRRASLLPVAGKLHDMFYAISRPAQKQWVWEYTRTRRKYSVTRTEWRQKRSRLTTKLKSWKKEKVRVILDRKSHPKIRKQQRSKTDWRQRGQRATNNLRNWLRKIIDCAIDSVSSTWSSRGHQLMQVERGH